MRTSLIAAIVTLTVSSVVQGHDVPAQAPIAAITASDPVDWRIAQVRVARAGAAVLPDLDTLCAAAAPGDRARIRETVALMLLKSIDAGELRAHENLDALCRDDIARARALTADLRTAEQYDNGSAHLGPAPLPARQALEAAIALGGMAVPAAVDLCHGATGASRMYGLEMLRELDSTAQRDLLEALATDASRLVVRDGCEAYTTTVGAIAEHIRFSSWPFLTCGPGEDRPPHLAEAREYVLWLDRRTDERLHATLRAAGVREATSWDDYWRRARPALAGVLPAEHAAAAVE